MAPVSPLGDDQRVITEYCLGSALDSGDLATRAWAGASLSKVSLFHHLEALLTLVNYQ